MEPRLIERRWRELRRMRVWYHHFSRWLPRTLLWQTFLLVTLLLVMAVVAWGQIFRYFEEPQRARDIARMIVSVVNLTRTALINSDVTRRSELLLELTAREGIRIYPAEPGDDTQPLPGTPLMQTLAAEVRHSLGAHTRFASRWKTLNGFWISFRLDPEDEDEYWVMLPSERVDRPYALEWLSWVGATLLVAILGAYLIVSRIGTPLRYLARTAKIIGSGQTPLPLDEHGPQEIAVVAKAFNQMAGALARTDADRALILAGVSHDLRTPLARLRLGIEMSGAPESEIAAMVVDIEAMDRIIGQFLDFGRGIPHDPVQQFDLAALVHELILPYKLRDIAIELETPPQLLVHGRPLPLRRALTNLVDNALRYAGTDKPLSITVFTRDEWTGVEIADRGPGIPPAEVHRLLQPFTRLDSARSNTGGAGLGLAIVDRIVRSHNGEFDLLPRAGGGLRAIIRFPAPDDASTLKPPKQTL
ncbi:two-component sensor histidine kinase [Betaproteobacteria bacterium]|nr:two-component sensor histidine kinase [Betaproteobacteria bacterium]GHT98894.1 two-component sensor histidine kinase [Betaproteobacteria bacterium]GHU07018.1 two-component sensor histidine kinase [Betaproteobacteria bacterium]GHU24989.1 two-component sensor histidine kinase [Betaproteobacteria bacterium]GHU27731.1 two-component sensor histidine kinase [Betaproteobacteria bacterium]